MIFVKLILFSSLFGIGKFAGLQLNFSMGNSRAATALCTHNNA